MMKGELWNAGHKSLISVPQTADNNRFHQFFLHYSRTVLFTGGNVCFLIARVNVSTVPYNRNCVAVVCGMQLEHKRFSKLCKNLIPKITGDKIHVHYKNKLINLLKPSGYLTYHHA